MLGIMRKYQQSIVIKIVFGIIVLSFIGTIFLVWGRGEGQLTPSSYVAKVDGTKINYEEFQRTYYRLRDIYSQIYGQSLTPEIEKQLGLKKQALNSLIDAMLVRNAAEDMGIKVSKDDVQQAIAAMPAFQKNGAFNFDLYVQLLRANRISPDDFEKSKRTDLMIKMAEDKIKARAQVSDEEALQYFRKKNDKIDILFSSFSPDDVKGEIKLTDQELNDFLAKNQNDFKTPEEVSIAYVLVDPLKLGGNVQVSDADIQSWYQKHLDEYQGKGGLLPLAEVRDKVKAEAHRFYAGQKAYEVTAETFNKMKAGGDLNAMAKALGTTVVETPLFTAQQPAAPLAGEAEVISRAFLLKQNELGGPIETPKGIYLIKLKDRKPADVPPLAKIRAKVEEKAKAAKAVEVAQQKAEATEARLAKGDTAGLKLQETGSFGYDPKGVVPKIGPAPALMEAAFKLTTAAPAPTAPLKVGNRWYALRLKERIEQNAAAFAPEKEQIKKTLLPQKQEEELQKWLKELRSKAKIEINPALKDI